MSVKTRGKNKKNKKREQKKQKIEQPSIVNGLKEISKTKNHQNVITETHQIVMIPINKIEKREGRRITNSEKVQSIAESILVAGLISPITVRRTTEGLYMLIGGLHRLEAYALLEKEEIPAIVKDSNEEEALLEELDENVMRAELLMLEQCEALSVREEVLKKIGRNSAKLAEFKKKKVKDLAVQLNLSERTMQRRKQIANKICKEVRDILRATPIAKIQSYLEKISQLSPEEQEKGAKRLAERLKEYDNEIPDDDIAKEFSKAFKQVKPNSKKQKDKSINQKDLESSPPTSPVADLHNQNGEQNKQVKESPDKEAQTDEIIAKSVPVSPKPEPSGKDQEGTEQGEHTPQEEIKEHETGIETQTIKQEEPTPQEQNVNAPAPSEVTSEKQQVENPLVNQEKNELEEDLVTLKISKDAYDRGEAYAKSRGITLREVIEQFLKEKR